MTWMISTLVMFELTFNFSCVPHPRRFNSTASWRLQERRARSLWWKGINVWTVSTYISGLYKDLERITKCSRYNVWICLVGWVAIGFRERLCLLRKRTKEACMTIYSLFSQGPQKRIEPPQEGVTWPWTEEVVQAKKCEEYISDRCCSLSG